MNLLPTPNCVTSCVSHLKNTGFLSYKDLLNVDTSHHTLSKKPTLTHVFIDLLTQVFNYWKALKLLMSIQGFLNSNFCLQVPILLLATNTNCCFLWSDGLTLFSRMRLLCANNHRHCSFTHIRKSGQSGLWKPHGRFSSGQSSPAVQHAGTCFPWFHHTEQSRLIQR